MESSRRSGKADISIVIRAHCLHELFSSRMMSIVQIDKKKRERLASSDPSVSVRHFDLITPKANKVIAQDGSGVIDFLQD